MKTQKYVYGSHEKLIAWRMADELDLICREILKQIPRNEFKTRSQIDNASDSVGANIVEGYYSNSTAEFVRFLRYARRSCGEVGERIRRVYRKEFISEELYKKAKDIAIRTGYIVDRLLLALSKKIEDKKVSKMSKKSEGLCVSNTLLQTSSTFSSSRSFSFNSKLFK